MSDPTDDKPQQNGGESSPGASDQPKSKRTDTELEEFRNLMMPPDTFEEGFDWIAFLGALFVAAMMVPGSIYMTLIAGQGIGPAAQWVTLILFIEVARRANRHLKKAEIFTLFYIAGAIMATASQAQGKFMGGLGVLWQQFFVQSNAAQAAGLVDHIPGWVAPTNPDVLEQRSFLMWEWAAPLGLAAFTMIIGRIDNMVLGYGLFRLTSDIERLPFPLAPIQAQGILALSEEQEEESQETQEGPTEGAGGKEAGEGNWRWRVFAIGTVMGLVFGALYLGLPTISGALLGEPITILPLPYVDFTERMPSLGLDAVAMALALDLGMVIVGMVLPFWAMVGSFVGLLITVVLNPILYQYDILKSYVRGDDLVTTFYKNQVDFYFSFSIGIALAIAIAGFFTVFKAYMRARERRREGPRTEGVQPYSIPEGRGDIRPWLIMIVYLVSSAMYIGVSMFLITITAEPGPTGEPQGFHWPIFGVMCFYAFIYTPLISYVSARLEGIAGEVIAIPFVREASFILSGYHGVAVWFVPIPFHNYGQMTVFYRTAELTGTRFWSIWKAEIFLIPIILIGTLVFAHFIWGLAEIPGPMYPYAQEMWELHASQQALVFSSTMGGFTEFEEALNGWYVAWGFVLGSGAFAGLALIGAPVFLMYGVVRGLNQTLPFFVIPQFIGAMLGRFYFRRKMGLQWRQYIPVVAAGFSCGMGLIGTLGVGFTFLTKSVFTLPF